MRYYVLELNIKQNGQNENAIYTKTDDVSAMKLYHQKCASDIDNKAYSRCLIMVVHQNGTVVAQQQYSHEPQVTEE